MPKVWMGGMVLVSLLAASPAGAAEPRDPRAALFQRLAPLHELKRPPGAHDWLAGHREPGQDFAAFLAGHPVGPVPGRDVIYIALLGEFDPMRRRIVEQAAEFFSVYFQMEVRFIDPVSLADLPSEARRVHPVTGDRQVLTRYLIKEILLPRKPADAFCLIGFTSEDLWPGAGWNFVFGEASMDDRVGVWSLYRNGDPHRGPDAARLCLLRTIKTGTHEIGHMFGLAHCIYYECAMNGSNHRAESDRRPLALCPICLRKLTWSVGFDPYKRYRELSGICRRLGFEEEARFYERSAAAIAP